MGADAKRVVVLGASGQVGRHVVAGALARGWHVRAVVRPGTTVDLPDGVEVLRGEILEGGVAERAVAERDAVISAVGPKRRSTANPWSAPTSPPDLCARTAERVGSAMVGASVRRVVAVSAAGVAESAAAMNVVMRLLVATSTIGLAYRDLARMEAVYERFGRESGLDWLCPRPVTLTDRPATGAVREVDGFGATMTISRADVAAFLLDAADRGWSGGRTPQIAAG